MRFRVISGDRLRFLQSSVAMTWFEGKKQNNNKKQNRSKKVNIQKQQQQENRKQHQCHK